MPADAAEPFAAAWAQRLSSAAPVRRLRGRNRTKADILVYRLEEVDVAVKTYGSRSWLVRNTVGRFFIGRETAAYRAARDVPGLPRFLGRLGPFSLATSWIRALPLSELDDRTVADAPFRSLRATLDALHRRGVALADFHRSDVLIGEDGAAHLVDLAMAVVLGRRAGPLRRFWFRRFRDRDLVALARMRAMFSVDGGDEVDAVDALGPSAAARYRAGKRWKRLWDRLRGRTHP